MKISGEIKRLLLMNVSAHIIFNYIGIFVNLYIWEEHRSIFEVTWLNFIMLLNWTLFYAVASRLLTSYSNRTLVRIIAMCGATTFLLLVFLHLDNRLLWITIVALPIGAMWGLYAATQNITVCVFGKGKDFLVYFTRASILLQIISIVNPVVFALVISWIGFSGSFLLMFLFVAMMLAVSFVIPTISLAAEKVPLFRDISFRKVFSVPSLRWLPASCLTGGFIQQFQNLFALLYTFSISEDKLMIALLNVLYTLSSITGMVLFRKIRIKEIAWFGIGMAALSAGFLIVLFPYSPLLVVSNILTTLGMFFFGTIFNSRQFAIISHSSIIQQARIFMWRELTFNVARITMLILVLNIREGHGIGFIFLLLMAMACAGLTPYFTKRSADAFELENER